MTKIALVVMTILSTSAALADDFQVKIKEDQQLIQVRDDQHQWTIDVDCREDLRPDESARLSIIKRRVQVGQTIKVKQGKDSQRCKVNQLAVVSLF